MEGDTLNRAATYSAKDMARKIDPFALEITMTNVVGEPVWLNVDKTRTQVLHYEDSCADVVQPRSKYKPANSPGRDGQWLSFRDVRQALIDASTRTQYEKARPCKTCMSRSTEFSRQVHEMGLMDTSRQYFWVNQGTSYEQEREHGIVWAPERDKSGKRLTHWEMLLKIRPGDVVFCYHAQQVKSVAVALDGGHRVETRPISYEQWEQASGYQAELAYEDLTTPLSKQRLQDAGFFANGLGEELMQADGRLKLIYMHQLTEREGLFLLEKAGLAERGHPGVPPIINSSVVPDETTRLRLVEARIGQGKFRDDLMESWGGRCPLSGLSNPKLLRASHIKRWADSTNEERLSPHNGILLAAHWDAAFDCGLISFADDGRVIVSEQLSQSDRVALRLPELASVRFMPPHIPFLESHRKRYGFRLA